MEVETNQTYLFSKGNNVKKKSSKLKAILATVILFFFVQTSLFAQLLCETEPATTDGNLQNSNRMLDAIIIGISVMIVLFTLVMSIKYLFKPGENNPEHIKNIVKDEGF